MEILLWESEVSDMLHDCQSLSNNFPKLVHWEQVDIWVCESCLNEYPSNHLKQLVWLHFWQLSKSQFDHDIP